MPPGSQMTAIKSRKKGKSNQATKMERNTTNRTLGEKMRIGDTTHGIILECQEF